MQTQSMGWRVLVVEDDPAVAKVLRFLLADRGYHVMVVDDPRAVVPTLRERSADIVLIDTTLPYIDAFALCDLVRGEDPDIPVIFLSATDRGDDKLTAFEHGADDYVTKPFAPDVLLARVQAVLQRYQRSERNAPASIVSVGETSLDVGRLQFHDQERPPIALTPTEMRILECLMRNAHAIIPRERLIELTNAHGDGDSSNRIDVYIRRLRKKIEATPDHPSLIHTVRGLGYIFRDDRTDTSTAAG